MMSLELPSAYTTLIRGERLRSPEKRVFTGTIEKASFLTNHGNEKSKHAQEISRMLTQLLYHGIRLLNADGGGVIFGYSSQSQAFPILEQSGVAPSNKSTFERLSRHVCERREAIILDDRLMLDDSLAALIETTLSAVIVVPVSWEGVILGTLGFATSHPGRAFTSAEFEIAQMLGSQAGLALHSSQLIETARHEIDGLGRLQAVAKELLASADIKHMMYIIARETVKYAQAQDVHIYLYEDETDTLTLGTSLWGPTGEVNRLFEPPRSNGLTRTVSRTGKRIIVQDPANHPLFKDLPPRSHAILKFQTILGLPLKQDGRVIGVLNAFFDSELTEETLHFLDELEDQAALAFQKGQAYQQQRANENPADFLVNAAQALSAAASLDEVLRNTLTQCPAVLPYDSGVILYFGNDAPPKLLVDGAHMNEDFDPDAMVTALTSHPVLKKITSEARPAILPVWQGSDESLIVSGLEHIRSWLCIPLATDGLACGLLLAGHIQPDVYRPEHCAVAQQLADLAMLAVENTLLCQALEDQAQHLETQVEERAGQIVRDREMLRAIVESAGEGIIFMRPNHVVEFANQAWLELVGLRTRDVMGKSISEIFPDACLYDDDMTHYRHGNKVWDGEFHARRADGSEYDTAVTFAPVVDLNGQVVRLVGTFRDVTAQKEVERMRRKFMANVSHELRTPITSLKLYHSLLARTTSGDSTADYLSTMIGELDRLEKLVQDLLDISSLDRGKMPVAPQAVDLAELVHGALRSHQARADKQGLDLIEIRADQPLPINADRERMLQVLANLLVNAINHTPARGKITVSASQTEESGEWWAALSIADTGTGIPPQDIPFIFDRFFRSETSKASRVPGTGLGLSIVREIVDLHGGKIKVQSNPNQGTKFTVLLPLASQALLKQP